MTRKRSKRLSREQKLWLILLLGGFALILYFTLLNKWQQQQEDTISSVRYEAFGIQLPPGYAIHGIDVSVYQGPIHWPSVYGMKEEKLRMGFAFMKATEGLNDTDKRFHKNWNDAKQAGMIRGAYHFFLVTKSGKKQALQFIQQVSLKKGDLPPVVDIEKLYGVKPALMRERLKEWLKEVESYYQVKPVIYTYADFYERHLGDEFKQYPLWVAHYFKPDKPKINRSWQFWQHSEQGSINGIRSKVDCNVFNGDSIKFKPNINSLTGLVSFNGSGCINNFIFASQILRCNLNTTTQLVSPVHNDLTLFFVKPGKSMLMQSMNKKYVIPTKKDRYFLMRELIPLEFIVSMKEK